jgi:hypothetical protein
MMPATAPRIPDRRPPILKLAVALLGLPLLAGCAETQQPQREVDWRKYLPKEQPKEAPAKKTAARRPANTQTAAIPDAPPSASSGAGPAPAPLKLIGTSDQDLRARLGTPAAEREVGPARVWTYRGRDCAVDLWLYFDTARAGFYALEQELSGAAATSESCLNGTNVPAPAPLPAPATGAPPAAAKKSRGA